MLAAISALVTVWNYRRELINQKIAAAKWKKEYFKDLLKWPDEALLLLSEALHLCDLDPKRMESGKYFDTRHTLRVKLSALIDRGRWFFPNYTARGIGEDKPAAYRGYRHEALDAPVSAYQVLCALDYVDVANNESRRTALERAKRQFTSQIQIVLDPRSRDDEFRKLIGRVTEA